MTWGSKLATAALVAAIWAAPAAATDFIGDYSTVKHSSGNGLLIDIRELSTDLNFTLDNVGDTTSLDLFKIYTRENDVGPDDIFAKPISITFNFTSPSFGGVMLGMTDGEQLLSGVFHRGVLNWNNGGLAVFVFGNGGQLQIQLNDTSFNKGLFGLDGGKHGAGIVRADFTLNAISSAVPEPATWAFMLIGFGAVGHAMRKRSRPALAQLA